MLEYCINVFNRYCCCKEIETAHRQYDIGTDRTLSIASSTRHSWSLAFNLPNLLIFSWSSRRTSASLSSSLVSIAPPLLLILSGILLVVCLYYEIGSAQDGWWINRLIVRRRMVVFCLLVVVSSGFFVNFLSLLLSLLLFYFRKGGYKHPRGAIIERWHDETTTQLSRRSKRKVKVKLKHNHSLQRVTVIQPALHQLPSSVLRYSV